MGRTDGGGASRTIHPARDRTPSPGRWPEDRIPGEWNTFRLSFFYLHSCHACLMTRIIWVPDENTVLGPVLGSLRSLTADIVCLLLAVSYLVPGMGTGTTVTGP